MNSRHWAAWLTLALICTLPACSGKNDEKDGKSTDGSKTEKIELAFVTNNTGGFWNYAERGCEQAAKDFQANVSFRRSSKGTAAEQQAIVEDMMITGLQGLAISPQDAGNFVGFFKSKVMGKIPLVMADNDLPDPKARNVYVGTHNYRAGRAAGALVKKAIPGGGKIVIFVGRMDSPNAIERRQGVLDYLAGKDQREMTDRTPAGATDLAVGNCILVTTVTDDNSANACQKKAEELLVVHPDLACLIGLWEYNPPAMLLAVKAAKYKTKIVGFDENFETLEAIQKGDIVGTIVQNPYMFGYKSIKLLAGLVRKDADVFKGEDIDSDNRIYIPHRVIVRNPGDEKIGNSETIDVDVFYPLTKKLRGE
jgi:ribose transport system substrate-binding protein